MSQFSREEIETAVRKLLDLRDQCSETGNWMPLGDLFTDDAVYIDPAWGRVEGLDAMRNTVFGPGMVGLEDWTFPTDFFAVVDNNTAIIKWRQRFPGKDGTIFEQSGVSTVVYAGDGKFSYEEDLLNMAHVMEDIAASGWRPRGGVMHLPPASPDRNFAIPGDSR